MSIDPQSETVLSLTDAAREYPWPRRRGGKLPNVATLYRWSLGGCRGVLLETIQVGGTRCTSLEAIDRFIEAGTAATGIGQTVLRSPAGRQRAIERAERELSEAGI